MEGLKKTIFITGSTKGIGLEIAKKFKNEKFFVLQIPEKKIKIIFFYIKGDLSKTQK